MKYRRVVITGLGVVSPVGVGIDPFWKSVKLGKSGIAPITSFDASMLPVPLAGEIKDNELDPKTYLNNRKQLKLLSRGAILAMAATKMAINDSDMIDYNIDPGRIGMYLGIGHSFDNIDNTIEFLLLSELEGVPRTIDYKRFGLAFMSMCDPKDVLRSLQNLVACNVAIANNHQGPVSTFRNNFISGAQAIGYSYRSIQRGDTDIMICGGTEAILSPYYYDYYGISTAFMSLFTKDKVTENACRPFDADRDGAVFGEGAGIVILEDMDHAMKREANIYGEVVGYGLTSNSKAFNDHIQNKESTVLSMKKALGESKINPFDVNYLNADGSSTKVGDKIETQAIKEVFGKHAYELPISSTKSMMGHLLSGSGAVELITCVLAMRDNIIPPTINYKTPDPDCDLDYVPNKARQCEVSVALSNSIGLFGESASLLVRKLN